MKRGQSVDSRAFPHWAMRAGALHPAARAGLPQAMGPLGPLRAMLWGSQPSYQHLLRHPTRTFLEGLWGVSEPGMIIFSGSRRREASRMVALAHSVRKILLPPETKQSRDPPRILQERAEILPGTTPSPPAVGSTPGPIAAPGAPPVASPSVQGSEAVMRQRGKRAEAVMRQRGRRAAVWSDSPEMILAPAFQVGKKGRTTASEGAEAPDTNSGPDSASGSALSPIVRSGGASSAPVAAQAGRSMFGRQVRRVSCTVHSWGDLYSLVDAVGAELREEGWGVGQGLSARGAEEGATVVTGQKGRCAGRMPGVKKEDEEWERGSEEDQERSKEEDKRQSRLPARAAAIVPLTAFAQRWILIKRLAGKGTYWAATRPDSPRNRGGPMQVGEGLEDEEDVERECPAEDRLKAKMGILREFGFQPLEVVSLMTIGPLVFFRSDAALRTKLHYLSSIGIPRERFVAVARQSQCLAADLEKVIIPKVRFLRKLGFEDPGAVLSRYPGLFDVAVPKMAHILADLERVIPEAHREVALSNPRLLLFPGGNLAAFVDALVQSCQLSQDQVVSLLRRMTKLTNSSIPALVDRLAAMEEAVGKDVLQGLVLRDPRLLTVSPSVIRSAAQGMRSVMESEEDARILMTQFPRILTTSWKRKTGPIVAYLQDACGIAPAEVLRTVALCRSLNGVIRPRIECLKAHGVQVVGSREGKVGGAREGLGDAGFGATGSGCEVEGKRNRMTLSWVISQGKGHFCKKYPSYAGD